MYMKTDNLNIAKSQERITHVHRINKILTCLLPESRNIALDDNMLFRLNEKKEIGIIKDGCFILRGANNRKVIDRKVGPYLFMPCLQDDPLIQTLTSARLYLISMEKAVHLIREYNLWEDMFFIVRHNVMQLARWQIILKLPSSFEIVYEALKVMNTEPPEIKYSVNALNYVQEKTALSRSCILKIFSELTQKKLISLQRGTLMSIK